jgi:hypothetical protein
MSRKNLFKNKKITLIFTDCWNASEGLAWLDGKA